MSNLDMNVTLQHVKQVVECLRKEKPIREHHLFDQGEWGYIAEFRPTENFCTTAGCTWGSAFLLANNGITTHGPDPDWIDQSAAHQELFYQIFTESGLEEDEIVHIFDGIVRAYSEAFNA
jgi:hypothetical protein